MEWNDDTILRLRGLWTEGHSTAEIGRRMGITKNAVVGKAHRLTLPPRPSPIRCQPGRTISRTSRRISGSTLPPLAASNVVSIVADAGRLERSSITPRPTSAQPMRAGFRVSACCWPIGEPGTAAFRFCDHEALHGKPYCRDHAQIAYVKARDRKDEVA